MKWLHAVSKTVTFLHTADWQLGKPFSSLGEGKREIVRQQRLASVMALGQVARESGAAFVVVAGDLFDSPTADRETVAAACSAIGGIGLPVFAIPGNHDHGGPGSVWNQTFFQRQRHELAPNFHLLDKPLPHETEGALLLPCPLRRRHEHTDPTAWLRDDSAFQNNPLPRILVAHGSVESFGEEEGGANLLALDRLPAAELDYIALGDWHGTIEAAPKAWYAGTPEPDRFPKGGGHDQGNVLVVTSGRGRPPEVRKVPTGSLHWHRLTHRLVDAGDVAPLRREVGTLASKRANRDLLELEIEGSISLAAADDLNRLVEDLAARLLHLRLHDRTVAQPSEEELAALVTRPGDPIIARVAAELNAVAEGGGDSSGIARIALRELHTMVRSS